MPEVREVNLVLLPDCAPCKIMEGLVDRIALERGLTVKKILAKRKMGTEKLVLVSGDQREEVEEKTFSAFPSLWLSFKDGSNSRIVSGVMSSDGRDALTFLLEASDDNSLQVSGRLS